LPRPPSSRRGGAGGAVVAYIKSFR